MRCLALIATAAVLAACQPEAQTPVAADNDVVSDAVDAAVEPPPTIDVAPENPSAEALSATPPEILNDYRSPLRLTGTEPFWGVQINDKITLQRPDHADVVVTNAGPTINGKVAMWNARGLTIRLEPQPGCSDGMSDNRYPYAATVTVSGEVLKGCAARADQWPRGGG